MSNPIVRAAIHPAIGIARVGDSPDEFYIGPEKPDGSPMPVDNFRDAQGRLKRQAARFRIYGYDAAGNLVKELSPDTSTNIEWQVQVANTKSAWYDFDLAMDIPEATPEKRRNAAITGADRQKLEIRPTARSVTGANATAQRFDDGTFMDTSVYLGEISTDSDGRLMFLGGHGVSASYDNTPVYTFANNNGWHDDVCDGPVSASLTIDGETIPVDPAWVVVAPPNYGTELKSIVTLYQLLTQTMIEAGFASAPQRPNFERDIQPILKRMNDLQWLNEGFLVQFADGGPQDYLRPELWERLASPAEENKELRRQVFNAFRNPDYSDRQRLALPWIYGDGMELPVDSNRQWMAIPPYLYKLLSQWAEGDFDDQPPPVGTVNEAQQLDHAALEFCLADAFHPGCEVTWPVRHSSMYMGSYRLLQRVPAESVPDYGDELQPKQVYDGGWASSTAFYGPGTPGGPLWAQGAGDLTRWMAVPWQTDTASCRDGYDSNYDSYVPTFWPTRVPNQVLDKTRYDMVMDTSKSDAERIKAFRSREEWTRTLGPGGYLPQIRKMIDDFGAMGVIERRAAPVDHERLGLPAEFFVEDLPEEIVARLPENASMEARKANTELRACRQAVARLSLSFACGDSKAESAISRRPVNCRGWPGWVGRCNSCLPTSLASCPAGPAETA